jgi:hypothetical protein
VPAGPQRQAEASVPSPPRLQVSVDPSRDPRLAEMLTHFTGFDSVDDESKVDASLGKR